MEEVIKYFVLGFGFGCSVYMVVLLVCIASHADIDGSGLIISSKAIKEILVDSIFVFGAIVIACVACAIILGSIFIAFYMTVAQ